VDQSRRPHREFSSRAPAGANPAANAISKGDPDGKAGIVAGIIIAGAVSIMTALFAIFGLQDAVVAPRF
jgi:hypothetical protein